MANVTARNSEMVTGADIGKTGYQADTNTYYRLTSTAPSVWQPVPDPSSTSALLSCLPARPMPSLITTFFHLQIAFEDVWAELLDPKIESAAKQFYGTWDALMEQGPDSSHEKDRQKTFSSASPGDTTGVDELKKFLPCIPTPSPSRTQAVG
jgi:hypothetical protein